MPNLFETIGQRLERFRQAAGFSQRQFALMIGVNHGQYARWERDSISIPKHWLPKLAEALGIDVGILMEVHLSGDSLKQELPKYVRTRHYRAPEQTGYSVKGTLEEMQSMGETAGYLLTRARRSLTVGELAYVGRCFPRDSVWELLAIFHVLALSGRLSRISLEQLRCPLLIVLARNSIKSGLYCRRDVLVLQRAKSVIVFIPQTWIVAPTQAEWYRLDFLVYVIGKKGGQRWLDVEIDGSQHGLEYQKDERRARGIAIPRLGFPLWQVEQSSFGERLVSRIETMLEQPHPTFSFIDAKGTRASDPYDPWARKPKRQAS